MRMLNGFSFSSQESPPNVASSFEFDMELECDLGAIQNEELLRKMVSESQSYVSISLCLGVARGS